MREELSTMEQRLVDILGAIPSCVIAFSGGLDSVFLAIMAKEHVPGRALCVTVADSSTPKSDLESAKKMAEAHGLEHLILESEIHPEVRPNTRERCYICKSTLLRKLESIREKEGLARILDGENASDSGDDRPGTRAARELGILSPLTMAGLTKDDVRALAREMGLEAWDRPASACLASRIPFGTVLDDDVMKRIDKTEDFIRSKGIRMIRARAEGNGARLELGQDENTPENRAMLESLATEIMKLGWGKVEIDQSGYVPAGLRKKNGRE
ncbi:MAG: ATP-dependent sacrificial sulfur transferase LarE [Thermoplasmata archaeon]